MTSVRIALAEESDFQLGPWHVQPSLGLMRWGERVEKLEPRVLQALVVLTRAGGRTVSRDELMRRAWGVTVSDDAIGRCIARLRAVLGRGDGLGIETIPKIGYRLVGLPEEAEQSEYCAGDLAFPDMGTPDPGAAGGPVEPPSVAAPLPVARRVSPWVWLAGAAVFGIVIGGALVWRPPSPVPSSAAERLRTLTADAGREIYPALSPTGGLLVYSARPAEEETFSLWLKSVEDGAPIRLTRGPAHDVAAAWSPDGARLAFIRVEPDGTCRIMVMPVTAGAEREVGRCTLGGAASPTWTADNHILFSDRPSPSAPARVVRLVPTTGERQEVTAPPPGIAGDYYPRVSPDGRLLAFSRRIVPGVEDVHVLDLPAGTPRRLTSDGRKLHGLDWYDGAAVVMASNRDGDFSVWRVDVADGTAHAIAPGLVRVGHVAGQGRRVVAEVDNSRAALFVLGDGTEPRPAGPPSSGRDWSPTVAPDGAVAFISDRTGRFEVWLSDPGQPARKLSSFDGPLPDTPQWSPTGDRLALVLTGGRGTDVVLLDRAGSPPTMVATHAADDRWPFWSADGRWLYFTSNRDGGWRIWRTAPPYDRAEPVTGPGWTRARESRDGAWLFLSHESEPGLWRMRLPGGVPERFLPDLSTYDVENWTVAEGGVLAVRRPGQAGVEGDRPVLAHVDAATGAHRVVAAWPDRLAKGGFALAPDGTVIVALQTTQESDLVLAEPAAP